jgi:hypothetical protein
MGASISLAILKIQINISRTPQFGNRPSKRHSEQGNY